MKKIIIGIMAIMSFSVFAFAQNYDKQSQFCSSANKVLFNGYRGGGVKEVQWMLQQYNAPWLQATDYYGPVTVGAVKSFQRIHGIYPTGSVGPITLSKMRNLWCSSYVDNNPIFCTQEVRYCSNGSLMQRDANCTWRSDLCGNTNNNSPVISINPISSQGNNVTISWSTINANSCTINGEYVSTSGNKLYTIYSETIFRINCQNSYGSSGKVLTVRPENNYSNQAPILNLYTNPSTVYAGQNSILVWTSQNANSCTLNNSSVALSGSQTIYVNSGTSNTYTLTCTGFGGTASKVLTVNGGNIDQNQNVSISTTLNKNTFFRGENINITTTIRNNGNTTITYPSGSGSCPNDIRITINGIDFYTFTNQQNRICTMDMQYVTLTPGQTYTRYFTGTIPNSYTTGNYNVISSLYGNNGLINSTNNTFTITENINNKF
jgi:peptidoglycan hydrolase-like protein with peptidoglycan-binding domain